jgi:CRISPR-associated protein Cas1
VTSQGAYLAKDGENVLVRLEGRTRLRVPIHNLGSIVSFGNVTCSPFLMGLCGERGVTIAFLSNHGRFLARVQGRTSGNVLLRREQYRRADDPARSAEIARALVAAKISNCRSILARATRDHPDIGPPDVLHEALKSFAGYLSQLREETALDTVRGIEGAAARTYFGVLDKLIVQQKEDFYLHDRSRRPPLDNMNALLSFIYTLLRHDVASALESVGLDPAVGFLHRDRPGRPGLALDLMEEFRSFLADRLALSLINLRQIQPGGFRRMESGGIVMDDETRKTVLVSYQNRKQEEITHPFLQEKTTVGLLFHLQALLLARFLRGDLGAYPPFVAR